MKRILPIAFLLGVLLCGAWSVSVRQRPSAAVAAATATGGNFITNYTENGTNFQAHLFTAATAMTFTVSGGTLLC